MKEKKKSKLKHKSVSESSSEHENDSFKYGKTSLPHNYDNDGDINGSPDEQPSTSGINNKSDDSESATSVSTVGASSKITVLQNVIIDSNRFKPKLKDFSKNYEKYVLEEKVDIDNLSDSEETSLMHVLKDINAKELKKKRIEFNETPIIQLSNGEYILKTLCNDEKYVLIVTNKPKCFRILKTYSLVQNYKEKKKKIKQTPSSTDPIPMPDNLKQRHPLFGANYEQKVILDPIVERKLDETLTKIVNKRKKSAKKAKKEKLKIKQESEEALMEDEPIFQLLNEKPLEKIKKSQSMQNLSNLSIKTEDESEIINTKKKKRKIKEEPIDEEIITPFVSPKISEGTKKKKRKIQELFTAEPVTVKLEGSPKKKSFNSTLLNDVSQTPQFSADVSVIKSEENKKKVKKNSTNIDSEKNNLKLDILNNVKESLLLNNTLKKKKKKKERL